MKNRDIEKQLKKDAVPDIYDKILLSAQAEGLMPAQSETVEKKATGAPAKTRRNLFASLSAAFVAVAVSCSEEESHLRPCRSRSTTFTR